MALGGHHLQFCTLSAVLHVAQTLLACCSSHGLVSCPSAGGSALPVQGQSGAGGGLRGCHCK